MADRHATARRHRGPPAPVLRKARELWIREALRLFDSDNDVVGVGLVGSLGRGDEDDWSDVDLAVVVTDDPFGYLTPRSFPQFGMATMAFDARQNAPSGVAAVSGQYVSAALPLWVDLYAYPASSASWPSDCRVLRDRANLPMMTLTFNEHLATKQSQPALTTDGSNHRLLQLGLLPVAGKRVARKDPDITRMIEFLGGTPPGRQRDWPSHLRELRRLLAGGQSHQGARNLCKTPAFASRAVWPSGIPAASRGTGGAFFGRANGLKAFARGRHD